MNMPPLNNTTGTQAGDPLAELKDIHLPADISWWPLAPGWWMLMILCIVLLAGSYGFYHFVIKKRAYRKAALKELDLLGTAALDPNAYIESVAAIIRRTAICTEKNQSGVTRVAQLQGKAWQEYLQQAMPAEQAQIIAVSRYQPVQSLDGQALQKAAREWIKGHKA